MTINQPDPTADKDDLRRIEDHITQPDDEPSTNNPDPLQQFWSLASRYARLGDLEVFMGTPWGEAMAPPAWSFGSSPAMADELLALVLSGAKTATSGLYDDYLDDNAPLPQVSDLSIILDGAGRPRALIRDSEVVVARFDAITADQAAAEGEGDRTLDSWRRSHAEFWNSQGRTVDGDTTVVWERFTVLYHN